MNLLEQLLARLRGGSPGAFQLGEEDGDAPPDSALALTAPGGLTFDDDSVDALLNDRSDEATPADLDALLSRFAVLGGVGDEAALAALAAAVRQTALLSAGTFLTLVRYGASFLPVWPHLPEEPPPMSLGSLLSALWDSATGNRLRFEAGKPLWEWHEYRHEHGEARRVLEAMTLLAREEGFLSECPGLCNNHAFQFMEEGRWDEAADGFANAAMLAKESGSEVEAANSWINHWCCRFEREGSAVESQLREKLPQFAAIVAAHGWVAARRRALVYLARLHAGAGNREGARRLLACVLQLDKQGVERYLEADTLLSNQIDQIA